MAHMTEDEKPSNVVWGRPAPGRIVPEHRVYTSKGGRFTIERRRYCAPSASVGYVATDAKYGRSSTHDSLAEAKWWCHDRIEMDKDSAPHRGRP